MYSLKLYPKLNKFMYKISVEKPITMRPKPVINKKNFNIFSYHPLNIIYFIKDLVYEINSKLKNTPIMKC